MWVGCVVSDDRMGDSDDDLRGMSTRQKLRALLRVFRYKPRETAAIAILSVMAAGLEAIGLSFILPIVEIANGSIEARGQTDGLMNVFVTAYEFVGVPLSLETAVMGVAVVMFVRYSASFFASWTRKILQKDYRRHLTSETFVGTMDARVSYFDTEGSDDIINAIITQTKYGSNVLTQSLSTLERTVMALAYLGIGLYLAPMLTLLMVVLLGCITYVVRNVIEPGYVVGRRVADANEQLQNSVQTGVQGVRDVKVFQMGDEVKSGFRKAIDRYVAASVRLARNKAFIDNAYQFSLAVALFSIIYLALAFFPISLGELAVFLFAMFRLAPQASTINSLVYTLEGNLPHLVRTFEYVDRVEDKQEPVGEESPPERIDRIEFDDIHFAYGNDPVLRGVDFEANRGEFVAMVGPSGAGKSTIASLLARLYEPGSGHITVNDRDIDGFDLSEWRSKVSMVRQNPFVFNDTLEFNLTIGARDATREELDRACELARVDEFFDGLPQGYNTVLGDDGVQLSGGQRQRVALARALLTDAPILILDEATSDLDSHLEADIHGAIENTTDRTVVAIAHRLSTVSNADRIYTIEDGHVVERGTHRELLSDDGIYASMYASQRA
ncbi:ABC transporter ATP-binding protein [Halolamina sp.]|uniref:ABC transporter ATP-binding protein n=1 Tax=Halolamina sp. TaxID=1940283 RepID=UPI0035644740